MSDEGAAKGAATGAEPVTYASYLGLDRLLAA
jgi:hypothetical protein